MEKRNANEHLAKAVLTTYGTKRFFVFYTPTGEELGVTVNYTMKQDAKSVFSNGKVADFTIELPCELITEDELNQLRERSQALERYKEERLKNQDATSTNNT